MKRHLAAVASAVAFVCLPAFAQAETIPSADPAVVAATRQMLTTMKVRDSMVATMQQVEKQMPAQVRASAEAAIKGDQKMTDAQKADALRKLDQELPKMAVQMHAVLGDPTLVDEMIAEMVPLYAETYTLDEIRQLTAFYASPLGQKTLASMPTLMGRSMEMANRIMMPRIQKVMAQNTQGLTGK